MAVTQVGIAKDMNRVELQGLSTDTKPTTYGSGSTFYELDTRKLFVFDKNNVGTGSGWWLQCLFPIT